MNVVDQALATQIANIEKKTGKSLAELTKFVKASGLAKHGEIRDMLKKELGLGHGDANTLTHMALDPSRIPGASAAAPAAAARRRRGRVLHRPEGRAQADPRQADGRDQ